MLAIVLLGFGLRYYKLGKDSFWLDEAGQGIAAIQPRLIDTLMIVRDHAGAMPLDYLVSRVMASYSQDEKFMRLPSVIWGTLSIVVYFLLVRELDIPHKKYVSFLVAALLAVSPVHIQYSQEMRFYAALVFFYGASTLLLIRAIKAPSLGNWLIYVLVTLVGEYFHPYVLFTVVTAFVFALGAYVSSRNPRWRIFDGKANLPGTVVSGLILVGCYVPGYLFFNARQMSSWDLGLHLDLVLQGLGLWAIRLDAGVGPFGLWHLALLVGGIGGLLLSVWRFRRYAPVLYLLIAFVLQFALIVGLDAFRRYFFSARQIIHLAPLVLILVSIFIVEGVAAIRRRPLRFAAAVLVAGVICFSSSPYIKAIYDYSKGSGKEIAQFLISTYQPNQQVLVLPSSYHVVLDYYFLRYERPGQRSPAILTAENVNEFDELLARNPDIWYVVTPSTAGKDIRMRIMSSGFRALLGKSKVDFLFVRSP